MEEPGGPQSMESLGVGHDWVTSLSLFTSMNWRRKWHPTPVLLPGESHGRRGLVGCSPWGRKELDTTERLHFDFSLSCTGERNGNPLQCSCLENPRDGGAWWAAIYGVAQSRTQLKRLSSSSSDFFFFWIMYSHFKIPFYFLVMICVSLLRTSHSFQECSVFPHLVLWSLHLTIPTSGSC